MSRPSSLLADSLAKRYRSLEGTRAKIESFVQDSKLSRRDSAHMYEGLFLSAYVAFEGFLEDLFIGLLVANIGVNSRSSNIKPRFLIRSHKVAREVLLGSSLRKYVDWLPYENTLERAKIYFQGGRPFQELTDIQLRLLFKCSVIRNAIAHKSQHSLRKFDEQVVANTPLLPKERTPAGYLQGLFRTSPRQTRYENLIAQILLIARTLAR